VSVGAERVDIAHQGGIFDAILKLCGGIFCCKCKEGVPLVGWIIRGRSRDAQSGRVKGLGFLNPKDSS
jgi:hypothetical protein